MEREPVLLGRVERPRGRTGEVVVTPLGVEAGDVVGKRVHLSMSGARREVRIAEAWPHLGRLVIRFEGVQSIDDAEALRGAEIYIAPEDLPLPEEGEFYWGDLVGLKVVERGTGEAVGTVSRCEATGGVPLLVVISPEGEEILVPFAASICVEIDPRAGRIVAELPEGLRQLNQKP